MTAIDILLDWLGCVQAQQTPLYFGQDELEHWPDGLLETLTRAGLLRSASPANTLDCRGCAWGCHKPVQWYPQHPGSPPWAFILCDEEPGQGRIPVQPERLQQWQASPDSLAKWLADQVSGLSQAELLGALPDLPLHKILRLEGLTLSIDQLVLHHAMPTSGAIATDLQVSPANRIYLNGDFWTVTFNGQTQQLKNTKGMRLIALLIQKQGNPCHVLELEHLLNPAPPSTEAQLQLSAMTAEQLSELGLSSAMLESGDDLLDPQAIWSLRGRFNWLVEQLEDAKEKGDMERQLELEREQDWIKAHLSSNLGIGGRPRSHLNKLETVRKNVQKLISRSLNQVGSTFPELAEHLTALQTGTNCCYEPRPSVPWIFEPP